VLTGSLALVLLSLAAGAGAKPSVARGPTGVAQYVPGLPNPGESCSRVRETQGEDGVTEIRGTKDNRDVLCGSVKARNERFYPLGGHDTVLARGGDDWIHDDPTNKTSDMISGGSGSKDWSRPDPCDDVSGVERPLQKRVKKTCPKTAKASVGRSDAIDYGTLAYQARVECQTSSTGSYLMRFSEEPMIRAVDTSTKVDWQFVAWFPIVYQWNGTAWAQLPVSDPYWAWDWTVDAQDKGFDQIRNYWRARIKGRLIRVRTGIVNLQPGTYKMDIRYRWFKTARSPNHQEDYLAGLHFGQYETDHTHQSCTFPVPTAAARRASGRPEAYRLSQLR
ncbi:MAG: hypothetical protein M3P42_03145, partial [Actinomycetota bacterium]|nr:hypothetical protein [Actinomycetota bacterium]